MGRLSPRRLQTRLILWTALIVTVCVAGIFEIRSQMAARLIENDLRERAKTVVNAAARTLVEGDATSRRAIRVRLREFVDADAALIRMDVVHNVSGVMKITASSASSPDLLLDHWPAKDENWISAQNSQREMIWAMPVQGSPYAIVAVTSLDIRDRFVAMNRMWAGIFGSLLIVLLISLLHVMYRRIVSRRFDELLEGINRAKTGNLTDHIPADREDEIGVIAQTFNDLVDQVRSVSEGLQHQISQATASLDARNKALEETNRRLVAMQKQLLQSERLAAVGQMAATFAHEVGSPMSSLSAHVQLLSEDPQLSDEQRATLVIVRQQIHAIVQIIQDLLRNSRRGPEDFVPMDINAVLDSVVRLVSPRLQAQKIAAEMLFASVPKIRGYPVYLQEAILNIVNNALDSMPGGGALRVKTWCDRETNKVRIRIADTGSGINPAILEKVFEKFVTTKSVGNGAGLGLAIVKEIVDQHSGSVELLAAEGGGTAAVLTFPAAQEMGR